MRGDKRTPEDEFNARFLGGLTPAFLQQTPWYEYPFKATLVRFWRETPVVVGLAWSEASNVALPCPSNMGSRDFMPSLSARSRATSPAQLSIMTVIKPPDDGMADDVTIVRKLKEGSYLVRTPRYQAYTDILKAWAKNGTAVVEIAGNRRILTTVIAPARLRHRCAGIDADTSPFLFRRSPDGSDIGFDTEVPEITTEIVAVERQGATFEHAYDY